MTDGRVMFRIRTRFYFLQVLEQIGGAQPGIISIFVCDKNLHEWRKPGDGSALPTR